MDNPVKISKIVAEKIKAGTLNEREKEAIRNIVVEEAQSWLGTPYKNGCKMKGVAVDCAEFGIIPYKVAGLIRWGTQIPRIYRIRQKDFKEFILKFGVLIKWRDRLPGDMITFLAAGANNKMVESHVSIIETIDTIIHAGGRGVKRTRINKMQNICALYRAKALA